MNGYIQICEALLEHQLSNFQDDELNLFVKLYSGAGCPSGAGNQTSISDSGNGTPRLQCLTAPARLRQGR